MDLEETGLSVRPNDSHTCYFLVSITEYLNMLLCDVDT